MRSFLCLIITIFISVIIDTGVSGMGGGAQKIPMKPYSEVEIPDGEFLHYGVYTGGEKDSDIYYVTRKETGKDGGILYRIYSCNIPASSGKKPRENYSNWPSFFLIDPVKGSVMEMKQIYNTDTAIYKNSDQMYPYYFHYLFSPENSYADETIKFIKGHTISESKYHIRINRGFPAWDQLSYSFYSSRFLDARKGGIAYMVAPFLIKDPVPFAFGYGEAETITTKAGKFNANKINLTLADPFVSKLIESFMEGQAAWVENSSRRILIKSSLMGNETILEEISNAGKR